MFNKFHKAVRRIQPLKDVATLVSGTTMAQALPILLSPVLTRIYSPEDFGYLSVFISIVALISVVATFRYELAVIQPKRQEIADALVLVSCCVSVSTCLLMLCTVVFFQSKFASIFNVELGIWLFLAPLCVFGLSCYQTFGYWLNRERQYSKLAVSKVIQSVTNIGFSILIAAVVVSEGGLILGYTFAGVFAAVYLVTQLKSSGFQLRNRFKLMVSAAIEYRRLPLFSAPGALLDSTSLQMPILTISRYFDPMAVGHFGFTQRIIGAPMSLISGAVSQILLKNVASAKADEIYATIVKVALTLTLLSLPIIGVTYFFGEDLFGLIFGSDWRIAGTYAEILIFSSAARFIVSPLSMVLALKENVHFGFLWQLSYFIVMASSLLYAKDFNLFEFITIFVLADVAMYFTYFLLILIVSHRMKVCAE